MGELRLIDCIRILAVTCTDGRGLPIKRWV